MLPKMMLIRQNRRANPPITDIPKAIRESLVKIHYQSAVFRNKKVGIAVGSRGISGIAEVVKTVVAIVREAGGEPEIFAAMGCHGGASAEGQHEVLQALGICEGMVGAPIRTCDKATQYGVTPSGFPVYGNTLISQYEAVVPINRVKMHTDFEDTTESGLLKLLAIGVGNPRGCINVHSHALRHGYGKVIRETADVMIEKLPIAIGFMLTENWKHELDHLEAILSEEFVSREALLLQAVKDQTIKLPVDQADVLLVGEIGKNISGTGMDTKVVGRLGIIGQSEPKVPRIGRVVVLDVTDASHGNALGIGLADLSTMKVLNKINIYATAVNAVSSMAPEQGRLPCFLRNDFEAATAAVETVGLENPSKAHAIYIRNTNSLEYLAVSEALYADVLYKDPTIEVMGEPFTLQFNAEGDLLSRWEGDEILASNP